jgi:hypothetical protein
MKTCAKARRSAKRDGTGAGTMRCRDMKIVLALATIVSIAAAMPASAQTTQPAPGSLGNGQVGTGAIELPAEPSTSPTAGATATATGAATAATTGTTTTTGTTGGGGGGGGSGGGMPMLCLSGSGSVTDAISDELALSCPQ